MCFILCDSLASLAPHSTLKLLVYSEVEEENCSLYFSSCAKKRNENILCFKFKFLHTISNIFKPNQHQQRRLRAAAVADTLSLDTFKKKLKEKTFCCSGYL